MRKELVRFVRRINEVIAMMIIGDGVIALVAPRRHMLLWSFGPEGYKKMMNWFAERPGLIRAVSAAQIAGALLFALRQYEE